MNNKKKRKRKKQNSTFFRSFTSCVIASAVIFVFAFWHYEVVNPAESESHDVIISDVEYFSDKGKAWATFDASGKRSYFIFEEKRYAENDFKKLEQLAKDKTQLSVTYTNYKDWLRLLDFADRQEIVEIRADEEVVFSAEIHNEDMTVMRIMWSVIASIVLVCGMVQLIVYIKLER